MTKQAAPAGIGGGHPSIPPHTRRPATVTTEPTAPGPVCQFEKGCPRLVTCQPACGAATAFTPPAVWVDGDPLMEAIAAAVWERCGRSDSGSRVEDDPRTIAAAAASVARPLVLQAAAYRLAVTAIEAMPGYPRLVLPEEIVAELRRLADEEPTTTPATEAAVTMHAVPLPGSNGISSCCGRPPCEFVGERVTRDPAKVTCTGAAAGVRQDGAQS